MKITIISPFSFGYIDSLVSKLEEYQEVDLLYINTQEINFQYKSNYQRIKNFWLKNFFSRNIKKEFICSEIRQKLEVKPMQDVILVIRSDKLGKDLLKWLKSKTLSLRTFFFDGSMSITSQVDLIPYFDKIYSYDKQDVKQFGLEFLPNFIPYDVEMETTGKGVFNISSHDDRFVFLKRIADHIKELDFPCNIIVRKEKSFNCENLKVVENYLSLEEVMKHIKASNIILDIQKENQIGLSFRIFEALGYEKKLLTTNKDIKTYDFYKPENILVVDFEHPVITRDFLEQPYVPVPEEIRKKYRRDFWIKEVFGISKTPENQ